MPYKVVGIESSGKKNVLDKRTRTMQSGFAKLDNQENSNPNFDPRHKIQFFKLLPCSLFQLGVDSLSAKLENSARVMPTNR